MMLRGRTHRGRAVYVCDGCKTPLEKTRLGYKATPAAQAALQESTGEIIEFECEWQPGDHSYDGLHPLMESDGKIRLRDLELENEQHRMAHVVAARYANGNERVRRLLLQELDTVLSPPTAPE